MSIDIAALIAHYEQQHGPGCPSEQIAKDLLTEAQNKNDLPALLPLIETGVSSFRRTYAASQERAYVPTTPLGTTSQTANPARWKKLFRVEIVVEPGLRMFWGDMEVAHHEKRIEYLAKKVTGLENTIDRHRQAIDLIRAAGVTRLSEVPDVDLAPPDDTETV